MSIPFSVTDATGGTIAISKDEYQQQSVLRIDGSRVWVAFNEDAIAGQGVYIEAGDAMRLWGDRQAANVYLVCESGETATAYFVKGQTNASIDPSGNIYNIGSEAFKNVSVQYPLPVDGDSVYVKDVKLDTSTSVDFTGGTVEDLFNDLSTAIINSTSSNPKTVIVNFCRPVTTSGIAIGSTQGGTHSNVKIEALRGGTSYTTLNDNSASAIPFESRFYSFSTTAGNNNIGVIAVTGLRITFNTANTIELSFLNISKTTNTISTLQGLRPDGAATFIGATNNDNLRVSVQEYGDTPAIDAFDRLRTSEPFTLFDSKQLHDKQPLFWDESIGGSATSVHSTINAEVKMSVTTSASDFVIRQTKQRFNYQPGKSQLIFMTFHSPQATGITNRIGIFDGTGTNNLTPNNGIFFECDGSLSWNIAKNGTTTETVSQSSWNVDPLDGTGKSGITLDMTTSQILIIDYEWLGVGRVRVGFVVDGLIYYCHYFNHANTGSFDSVYMSSPNLPLRYSIETDGTEASHLDHICSTIMSEGGVEKTGILRGVDMGNSFTAGYGTTNDYALIGLRLKSAYSDVSVIPENISVVIGTNDAYKWELHLNPTVNGTFTYNGLVDSATEYAVGGTANTLSADGTILAVGGGSTQTRASDSDLQTALRIGSTIAGVQDELVLVLRPFSANTSAWAAFNFRELL